MRGWEQGARGAISPGQSRGSVVTDARGVLLRAARANNEQNGQRSVPVLAGLLSHSDLTGCPSGSPRF